MFVTTKKTAYDEAVLDGLIKKGIPQRNLTKLFHIYYPIILNIYRKEVEPERYVSMLTGIYKKRLNLNQVIEIVNRSADNKIKTPIIVPVTTNHFGKFGKGARLRRKHSLGIKIE